MTEFFDKSLHYLGKTGKKINALNIGAMDGILFDEMIGYTTMYKYNVLYVEPIPYLFEKLKTNIGSDGLFENSAISDYDGEIEMMMIDKEVIDSGLIHNCFYGMSAVYPPKNGLGSEFDRPTVEKYGKIVKVPCITFKTLLDKHNFHNIDIIKIDAEGHDYQIFKQIDLEKYQPKVVRLEWINLSQDEKENIIKIFQKFNYKYEISGQDIIGLNPIFYDEIFEIKKNIVNHNVSYKTTLVTGLWNIGRGELSEGWSRSFSHYLSNFEKLLALDINLIIFGDEELETFVYRIRKKENTLFIKRSLDWFKNNQYYPLIQKIRKNPSWYEQSGWLSSSTQASLEMYNPLVMSKMFLLHDAKLMDPFDSDYLYWIDAGISNTIHLGYFYHDKVLDKLPKYVDKFTFVCFPYIANNEIHGFSYPKINDFANNDVKLVGRGGFFGGPKKSITKINELYYNTLFSTLGAGFMGTEESIFSIMLYKHPDLINYFEIEDNGLLNRFFEDLKTDKLVKKNTKSGSIEKNGEGVALYVITFNSPRQFQTLIDSMIEYDKDFIDKPTKFLLNNSTDLSTSKEYDELCEKYSFTQIKKDNIGICGGRQFIAEHADQNNFEGYWFSEDDMFFQPKKGEVCKNGFPRFVSGLYEKTIQITNIENFDFIKINFTEFYGDNSVQWSWYNVPQHIREKRWPEKPNLPTHGLDINAPRTEFKNIKSFDGLPYASGEIYYCNWTHYITKNGNKKLFLDTKWAHPYENTWMSHIYQETINGNIKPGILLMTPIEHNRFDHYPRELRREN